MPIVAWASPKLPYHGWQFGCLWSPLVASRIKGINL
jgi:hypothetical protein